MKTPEYTEAQTVRFKFVEAPRYQEEVSGKGLCDQLKAGGKRTVVVTFDTWGNSYRGLIGYNEVSADAKPVVGVGGWGSSGAKEEIGPHPPEKVLLSPMDGQKFPETTSPISPFPRHYFMVFEMLEALDG